MTRRTGLRRLAAWCAGAGLASPARPAPAEDRRVEVSLLLHDAERRPLPGEALRLVLGTTADWRHPDAGQLLRTDAQGRARCTVRLPRQTRLKRWTSNYLDTVLSLPQQVDWLQVAVELPFLGSPCLYTAELDWFASQQTSVQSAPAAYWADESGRFTRAAQALDQGRSWRLPLPAYRGWVFTQLGHALVHGSFMPEAPGPDNDGGTWRVELSYRRDPPPVVR